MRKTGLRVLSAIAAVATLVGVVSGCGTAVQNNSLSEQAKSASTDVTSISLDGKNVQEGGTLTMGLSSDPDKLDPTLSSSLYSRYVFANSCEKLYDINAQGDTVPLLAASDPTISEDGKTYTFDVKQGVKFADGTDFNAAAVVKTLERDLNLKGSARKSELGPITDVKATGTYTVEIDLSSPYAPLTAALADRAGMIMSPKALDELGDNFASAPVCVGAFKVVERVPSTSITLEKDPNYYDAKNVHIDKIVYKIIKDAAIRAQNLKSGDVQVADNLTPQDVATLNEDPNITMMSVSSLGFQGLYVNVGNVNGVGQPVGDLNTDFAKQKVIRQAFDMSVDRDQLVQSVYGGLYEKACSFISDSSPFASETSRTCLPHDPAKAKQMLQDAGVSVPLTVKVQVSNTQSSLQMMQVLQSQVKEGGFDLQIEPVEYTSLLENMNNGNYDDAAQMGWSGRIDPDGNSKALFTTGGSMNYDGYSNAKFDDLIKQASQVSDTAKRADLYGQAIDVMRDDMPYIFLYRQRYLTGVTHSVAGVDVYGDGVVRLTHAAFVQ